MLICRCRGGNICATIMLRILEHPTAIPRPISMILAYPALDFNFTSWMSPANLRVLRTEQSATHIPGIVRGKDHMRHKSPLSVVDDVAKKPRKSASGRFRTKSWGETLGVTLPKLTMTPTEEQPSGSGGVRSQPPSPVVEWARSLPRSMSTKTVGWLASDEVADERESTTGEENVSEQSDSESEDEEVEVVAPRPDPRREADKSLRDRVKTPRGDRQLLEVAPLTISPQPTGDLTAASAETVKRKKRAPIGTRLTMTSRVGYFQDRIISPSMVCSV